MEQMWSRTGVPPSAWLRAARFDSSLGLVRAASGSAPQMKLQMVRTAAYPYGMAILATRMYVRRGQLWRRRASGEGLREACMRIGTAEWVGAGAGMPREARQEALGRRYATDCAPSLIESQISSSIFGKSNVLLSCETTVNGPMRASIAPRT